MVLLRRILNKSSSLSFAVLKSRKTLSLSLKVLSLRIFVLCLSLRSGWSLCN